MHILLQTLTSPLVPMEKQGNANELQEIGKPLESKNEDKLPESESAEDPAVKIQKLVEQLNQMRTANPDMCCPTNPVRIDQSINRSVDRICLLCFVESFLIC